MRFSVILAGALAFSAPATAQVGALQTDCKLGGAGPIGYQFVSTCAGRSTSPDKRFAIVQHAYTETQRPLELQDARGRLVAELPQLTDDMPFAVIWSPRPNWFLVNHHLGSFMDRPEVYEIRAGHVLQHQGIIHEARKQAIRISPCLRKVDPDFVMGDAIGWSRDGKRIGWYFETNTNACMGPHETGPVPIKEQWRAFWMISDAATGAIVPGSIRIIPDDASGYFPSDKLYSEFRPLRH